MAKGPRGERPIREKPAKRGTGDPLLEELQATLNRPVPPKEASPAVEPVAVSVETTAPAAPSPAPIEAVSTPTPAESTAPATEAEEPKMIPPELQAVFREVPSKVMEKYEKIADPKKRENFVENSRIAQQKQAEREDERRDKGKGKERKSKKPANPRVRKSVLPPSLEALVEQERGGIQNTIAAVNAARAEINKPPTTDPDAPTIKIPIEAQRLEAEEQAGIDERIATERLREPGPRLKAALEIAARFKAEAKAAEAGLSPGEQPPEVSVEVSPEAVQTVQTMEKERKPISHVELGDFVREKLGKEAGITDLTITETPGGRLHIRAELQHGMAGKIGLAGILSNKGDTVGMEELQIQAERFEGKVRSKIENALSGIGTEMKTYFERQAGRRISNIQVGESGLTVEFESPTIVEPVEESGTSDIAMNLEDAQEHIQGAEGTRKELTDKLKEAVGKLVEKTKEKVEWWKSSKESLIRRNQELDAQLEKVGGVEKGFRWIGEKYNKLNWKTKLAVGASLGLGAAVTAGVSMPIAFACMSGIAAQRAAGLATMYLKFEKNSHDKKWGKEKAMLKAGVYTVLMGLAMKEAVEYASQTEMAHAAQAKIEGWLGSMLGHESATTATNEGVGASAPTPKSGISIGHPGYETSNFAHPGTAEPIAPDHQVPTAAPDFKPPEAPQPAAEAVVPGHQASADVQSQSMHAAEISHQASADVQAAVSGTVESPVAAAMPEMPSVGASAGHGYEYMMKRLWEQLQEKHLDASAFDADSDIHKLLTADSATIDEVVHQIAADPKHGFFNSDGTSVRIDLGSHLAVNADGQLELNGAVQAPADAPVTPVYHPEASAATAPETVSSPHVETVDLTAAQEEAAKHIEPMPSQDVPIPPPAPVAEQPLTWHDGSGNTLVDSSGNPVHAGVPESLPGANNFGIVVPDAVPHIYADPNTDHLFAYGGSATERAKLISEYLMRDPGKIIYAADETGTYRVPWHLVEGKAVAGPPMRTNGIMGLFSTHLKPPGPEEFKKVIK